MCIEVRLNMYAFCIETDIHDCILSASFNVIYIAYLISVLSSINHSKHLMTYTANS